MNEVKSLFIQKDTKDKNIYRPIYYKLIKTHPDILIYHSGPIVEELKDRNIVITTDYDRDKDIIKLLVCPYIYVGITDDIDLIIEKITKTVRSDNDK